MPLYEYYCADCKIKFEALRPMGKADDAIECKQCESMHTSRALSMFAAHVKDGRGTASTGRERASMGGGCACGGGGCGCGHH